MMEAVIGDWNIEVLSPERHFRVPYVNTFDELVGGLMNVILAEDGQHYQHTNINEGRRLVQDIDFFTTDFMAVKPGGEVDYSLAEQHHFSLADVGVLARLSRLIKGLSPSIV